jgi:hypothetical protein
VTSLKNNLDSQSSLPSAPDGADLPSAPSGATENLITAALELLKLALSQVNQNEALRLQFAERTYQCGNYYHQRSDQQIEAALICSAMLSLEKLKRPEASLSLPQFCSGIPHRPKRAMR